MTGNSITRQISIYRFLSLENRMKKRLDKTYYEKYNMYNKSYFWEMTI